MLRKKIIKYVKYSSNLRKQIKDTKNKEEKEYLINELCDVYSRLEFLRGLNGAIKDLNKKEENIKNEKTR